MAEVGALILSGPPGKVWARSLRQEPALQDQYRRAIHHVDGGVANVGFDRWSAACCLQEQVDSARGVEHTRRLVKSRAIAARFTRRSVMKDLQGIDLQTPFARAQTPCGGAPSEDGSLTRSQALESFGIDLGRVGVMTSARTASRHSLVDRGRVSIAADSSSDIVGIIRGKTEQGISETTRGRGGSSDMTTVANGDSNISSKRMAARSKKIMSEKLKVLDKLLSDEFLRHLPADEDREKEGKTTKGSTQSEEDGPIVVFERKGTRNNATVNGFVDTGTDGGIKGSEPRLDILAAQEAPSCKMLAERTARACEASQPLAPEPKLATTVADIHAPGGGERGGAADVREAVLRKNTTAVKEVMDMERRYFDKKALPNHRPCWWWAFLLPPDVEGVCVPDMVFSTPRTTKAPTSMGSRTDAATKPPAGSTTIPPSTRSTSQQSMLWAFSTAAKCECGGGEANGGEASANPLVPRFGVTSSVEGEGCGGGPTMAYASTKKGSSPVQHPQIQQRFHTKFIDGMEELLCATRAICECGRRGGGGTDSEGGSSGLKLPLALLKIWGHESHEQRRLSKLGTPCRRRCLKVVSLWTETEVLRALRAMARGKWLRRGEQSEQLSGVCGSDQDACCVQAFTKSARFPGEGDNDPRGGGVSILNSRIGAGNQGRHERLPPPGHNDISGPVFYRAAWIRTGGKLFVWKITSRYPYVSRVSAHFCPLVRVGSAAPFKASQAEEGAVAMAAAKMENLANILRRAYDPTLQRLWADWAVNEGDGRWLLIEIHGVKTDADVQNAAAARAAPPAFAEVESKVYRGIHRVPPKHFCGDPEDLKNRIATANPTQELSLVELSKRAAAAASKHQPSRPPTPSKVAASTKRVLLAQRGVSEQERSRRRCSGARQMRNQYWRCAGDFCETHSAGQCRKSPSHGKVNHDHPDTTSSAVERQSAKSMRVNKSGGATARRGTGTDDKEDGGGGGGVGRGDGRDFDVEDTIGRRKHALAVEIPRTVLFRLVLNARATLLGWKPSAFDFSQMEKPVQLCSACFVVCNTLERQRIETTQRAMDAADQAAKQEKARRSRRPPGWKSRVQHELEESLDADRCVVTRLINSFEVTSAAAPEGRRKRAPSSSSRGDNHLKPRQKGGGGRGHGGVSVTWADRCPLTEVHLDEEEDRADASAQSTPRGKISVGAAGQTPSTMESKRRTKTAPLAPTASAHQANSAKTTHVLGAGAKEKPDEEGKKREIRARRRAKERARRRLRNLATDGSRARNGRGEPPGKKGGDIDFSGGNHGTKNIDDKKSNRDHELPTILRPTAATPMSSKVAPEDGLKETSGYDQPGQPHQLADSTTPGKRMGNEDEVRGHGSGESTNSCAISDYGDDDFMDDSEPQLLQPTASREDWEGKKGLATERQGDSEDIGFIPIDREGSNSDYGDEGFEDDGT